MRKLIAALALAFLGTVLPCAAQQVPIISGHSTMSASVIGISPSQPAQPYQGVSYSQCFTALNAVGSVTWALPNPPNSSATQNGLTFSTSTGCITGTPTNGTLDSWTVKWTDTASRVFQTTITTNASTFASSVVTCPGLPSCSVKTSNTIQLQATASWLTGLPGPDITPLATWACSGTGYSSISSTGLFTASASTGTPNCTATFNSIVDDGGTGITVTVTSTAPTFLSNALAPASEYQAYSSAVQACTGGTPPYTYALGTLSLQTGLSISSSTGVISGTPTASGTNTGTLTCTDAMSNVGTSSSLSLAVGTVASVAVNLASNPIIANTSTNATATGTYSNGNVVNFQNAVGGAQPYSVQGVNLTSGTSVQFGTPVSTTTGDTAVVIMSSYTSAHACSAYSASVTSANETFNAATTALGIAVANTAPYYNCAQMFYAYNITGASNDQPTCGWSVTVGATCVIQYYHGMLTTDPRDQHATPTQAASVGSCTPTAVTTTAANEVLVEGCVPNSATAFTSASGFTSEYSQLQPSAIFYSDEVVNAIQTSIAPVSGFSPAAQGEVTLFATFKANAPGTGVSWGTSDATCATVNQNGLIVAQSVISPCTVTITGTFNPGSVAGTATLTVNPASAGTDTSYIVTPATPTIAIAGQITFTAKGNVTGNTCASCTWASSNTNAATINSSSGVATGVAGGSATITASGSGISGNTILTVSGAGTTVTASTCGASDVQTAFNAVNASTTLLVIPSGTCTWATDDTFSVPSGNTTLTIQGSTTVSCTGTPGQSSYACTATDNTVLVDTSSGPLLNITTGSISSLFRITGITFKGGAISSSSGHSDGFLHIVGSSQNFRFDHNNVNASTYTISGSSANAGGGLSIYSLTYGVADHNTFEFLYQANGVRAYQGVGDYGDTLWSQPTQLGSANYMFVEDNVFTGGFANDCDWGGREVVRYNYISADPNDPVSDSGAVQTHQTGQGAANDRNRGCRSLDVNNNYFFNPTPTYTPYQYSAGDGGSGQTLHWNNTLSPGWQYDTIFENVRTTAAGHPNVAPPNGWGDCGNQSSGSTSAWDGNSNSTTGYPCINQTGRGQGDLLNGQNFPNALDTVTGTITWPHNMLEPAYSWNETCLGSPCYALYNAPSWNSVQMVVNQDFYVQCGSLNPSCTGAFNGTKGTGSGLLASRPSTCTAGAGGTYGVSPTGSYGVGYFATDANSGQGELYVCTATNTWTGIYQPYTYPHPLDH